MGEMKGCYSKQNPGLRSFNQSPFSKLKMSSTLFLNVLAIFNTRITEGIYFPVSMANIVWRDTSISSASSC